MFQLIRENVKVLQRKLIILDIVYKKVIFSSSTKIFHNLPKKLVKMGLISKLIVTLMLSYICVNSFPVEPESDKTVDTDSGMTTESMDTTITTTEVSDITSDQISVETTVQSTEGGEGQQRFARHQTDKSNEAPDEMPHTFEEPEASDQNIHEIIVKAEDNSNSPSDLNTEATSTGRFAKLI